MGNPRSFLLEIYLDEGRIRFEGSMSISLMSFWIGPLKQNGITIISLLQLLLSKFISRKKKRKKKKKKTKKRRKKRKNRKNYFESRWTFILSVVQRS